MSALDNSNASSTVSCTARCSNDSRDEGQDETCSVCLTSVHRGDERLTCDVCSQKIHVDCTTAAPEAFEALADYVAVLGYVCDDCPLDNQ